MSIQLRDYQLQLIEETFTAWRSPAFLPPESAGGSGKKREKVLLQLATGGDKTVIFASFAKEFTDSGKPIIAIAHREELITQAANKIREATQLPVEIIKAGYKADADCPI
ncbi:MAG: DEAD/DEAH box helicase family protein [Hydrococcus sp. RM1_1_31]|nr:DEAD/DEAH box helicase family protein [Hydrococcus sp. RM1_1_31]